MEPSIHEQIRKSMLVVNEIYSMLEAIKVSNEIERVPYSRDYPVSAPEKAIQAFTYTKTEKSDKWWDRTNNIVCNILAFSHDLDKLIDYLNENRPIVPEVPAYSAE